jgi:hypothetical protein
MPGNKQRGKLCRVLRERLEALACGGSRRRGVLTGAAAMAGQRRSVHAGRRTGGLFIGGHVHRGEQGVPRCPWRRIKGVARGNRRARASPVGNAARGPVGGSAARPRVFWGAARGGCARGSRGNRIMSLGRGVERPGGPDVEDERRCAGRHVADAPARACALAPDGPNPV